MKPSELIADESKWCQGQFAENEHGHWAAIDSPLATRWCLVGAIEKCLNAGIGDAKTKLRNHLGINNPDRSLVGYNDTHTHTEVVAALKACGL